MQTTIPFDNEKSYMILPEISLFFIESSSKFIDF